MKLFYQDEYAKIGFDTEIPHIFVKYVGFANNTEHFQAVHLKYFELLVQLRQKGVFPNFAVGISDMQEAKPIAATDIKWLEEFFFPKIFEQGYRYSAVILPQGILAKMIFEDIKTEFENYPQMKVKIFDNQNAALAWIQSLYLAEVYN